MSLKAENISLAVHPLTRDLAQTARLLSVAADPTRLRIICLLYRRDEVCVSDIAQALGMSVSAVSHQLQVLKDTGLVSCERTGQMMCYNLIKSKFVKTICRLVESNKV